MGNLGKDLQHVLAELSLILNAKYIVLYNQSDLSLHNLTFEDATELALDKSLWRLLVASGATH